MTINLVDHELKTLEAIKGFWKNRNTAKQKQRESGKLDRGERADVTAGKNMNGFIYLIVDIVRANGLENADLHQKRSVLTLPYFSRPWLVILPKRWLVSIQISVDLEQSNTFEHNKHKIISNSPFFVLFQCIHNFCRPVSSHNLSPSVSGLASSIKTRIQIQFGIIVLDFNLLKFTRRISLTFSRISTSSDFR